MRAPPLSAGRPPVETGNGHEAPRPQIDTMSRQVDVAFGLSFDRIEESDHDALRAGTDRLRHFERAPGHSTRDRPRRTIVGADFMNMYDAARLSVIDHG